MHETNDQKNFLTNQSDFTIQFFVFSFSKIFTICMYVPDVFYVVKSIKNAQNDFITKTVNTKLLKILSMLTTLSCLKNKTILRDLI